MAKKELKWKYTKCPKCKKKGFKRKAAKTPAHLASKYKECRYCGHYVV